MAELSHQLADALQRTSELETNTPPQHNQAQRCDEPSVVMEHPSMTYPDCGSRLGGALSLTLFRRKRTSQV